MSQNIAAFGRKVCRKRPLFAPKMVVSRLKSEEEFYRDSENGRKTLPYFGSGSGDFHAQREPRIRTIRISIIHAVNRHSASQVAQCIFRGKRLLHEGCTKWEGETCHAANLIFHLQVCRNPQKGKLRRTYPLCGYLPSSLTLGHEVRTSLPHLGREKQASESVTPGLARAGRNRLAPIRAECCLSLPSVPSSQERGRCRP